LEEETMLIGSVAVLAVLAAALICLCSGAFTSFAWLWLLPVSALGVFLVLAAVVFLIILAACAAVKIDRPQDKSDPRYRFLVDLLVEAAHTILQMRVHATGLEKTPKDGRFLLVCNHLNDLDPVVLLHHFRKSKLAFISKRENDQKFIIGPLLHMIGCQPINRENDREALKTILKCIQIINEDEASIAVFPEGYTSLDGLLHPFRSGVFKIAQKAKVPIVVCTLQNTQKAFANAAKLKPTDIRLHLLEVIPASELEGVTTVDIANRVHALMAEDLGPENVLQST
jgi:1-acyl-sn-glycerol-3-phosphate acyltransferase